MIHLYGPTHPILSSFLLRNFEVGEQELPQLALLERAPNPAAAGLITQSTFWNLKPLRRGMQAEHAATTRHL